MTTTPHLALPLLAAAQAQKHVTHNEAIAVLDALVQLSVRERDRTNPPAEPSEGDRYLVGAAATGSFAGHTGEVALYEAGTWRFFVPQAGWRTYVESERISLTFDGLIWNDDARDVASFEQLGIGTLADGQNPLSAKLNTALFTARSKSEGGSGDLRLTLNKETAGNVLSQLYQSGYSGRAETGLVGNDDFAIRVSSDGTSWRDALRVDAGTGQVSFPSGYNAGANLLINSSFVVNQRGFAGGALSSGNYGYDRWKAGTGGCTILRLSDGTISLTGTLEQIVDVANVSSLIGATNFAGRMVTFSAENPTSPLAVTVGSTTVIIAEGSGRRSATFLVDTWATGHLSVRLQSTGSATTTFLRPKLELGEHATPWRGDWLDVEETRCRRYYQRIPTSGVGPLPAACLGQRKGTNVIEVPYAIPTLDARGPDRPGHFVVVGQRIAHG